ncbi:MAG: hypothetical protein M1819_003580 [Sarea resinae]|nr:MAG: hypothetical protein M1819_003580 [Sarea resinae]
MATRLSETCNDCEILTDRLHRFLSAREPPKTFCPSEVARSLSAAELKELGVEEWRDLMPKIRELAWELRDAGEAEILQKGEPLDDGVTICDIKGPIRIRRHE